MGFCKKYTEFQLEQTFNYIGIRFLPAMFPLLFKVNANELSNRYVHLQEVVPQLSDFISNQFFEGQEPELIKSLLDNYFLDLVANTSISMDMRFYRALEIILRNDGVLNVNLDLNTGISSRQLRRLFEFYIGDSPKVFSQVVRFQQILKAKPSSQSLRQNKVFYDSGYYDQSHFIKEFRNFYGVTPSKAFGR